ncbi:class I SAM-dependent methyltransferase [Hyalangium versicolor]|uniref:class I SAM-dependent methyltransferase n=1 Tax=Hyalangium versicolor TaxID=2861190 RepID=UPI001CCC55B8|nr:class I SAM-dependent methyltransferase [Hyalangium versicolor]
MRAERWVSEAAFFDRLAEVKLRGVSPVEPEVVRRYAGRLRPWFHKEFRFELLGELHGQHVLDVGCGDGTNAILLASRGARVTGIDISPRSIRLATERARMAGVEDRVRFLCSPLEVAEFPENSFDVIWGDGILHHLIPELETVLERLVQWAKPGARVVFSEPLSLSSMLRRLRAHIPIHDGATPDERPLQASELEVILGKLPGARLRHFALLSWFNRFVLRGSTYERASEARRLVVGVLHAADYALLSLPVLRKLGSMVVISAKVTKPARGGNAESVESECPVTCFKVA